MNRRQFLSISGVAVCASGAWVDAAQASTGKKPGKTLVIVELKGGNDGLNTVVPFADPLYRTLRPTLGLSRDRLLQLDERTALHPATESLMPLWRDGRLAVVQGVGYAQPNLSHFRSTEIWDTASHADQYLRDGWLARALGGSPRAETIAIGSVEAGPFAKNSTKGGPMRHVAAPSFAASVDTAMRMLATVESSREITVLRLTLNGFDAHQNQALRHAALLGELSDGLVAMRRALVSLGRWDESLIMTCSEFGRGARENQTGGTDHGSAAPHFLAGGRVRGGLYGAMPALARIDGNGNLPVAVDFRRLYATVLGAWLGLDASAILQQRFEPLPLIVA
ncbi:DUF1501 domain-containing protein [Caballeronia telluris]|uniref:Twin-arginine translocation pathway signal sequence domain-containing protein n=1 Tax=Caballeronia telluris TaxID=326475 RepID=A0A158HCI9_9BURK|nr:DUF1501 domain-containing protein [Caballeronia telluris]SAL42036.1 twin-arginine translocation pathway signal sequence domain-containing protein [Caballeronia telluris]